MKAEEIIGKLSSTKRTKIKKLTVREIEQESKGNYIAFVDDAIDSFDVNLNLKNQEIIRHTCDCNSTETFCIHKTALLLNLSETAVGKTTVKAARTKKVKQSPAQQILQDLNLAQLTNWLQTYFAHNKEAEMQFLLEFSPKTITYQVSEIDQIIQTAFTSVMAKRKKIELNELKKIIQYLEQSLEPVFQFLQSIIAQEKAFLFLEEMIKSLHDKNYKYRIPGARLYKYQTQLIEKYVLMLNNLQDTALWEKQTNFLLNKFFKVDFGTGMILNAVAELHKNGKSEQKSYLSSQIAIYLNELCQENYILSLEADKVLLQIVLENNDLKNCYLYFTPYEYENNYNIIMLHALKEIDANIVMHYCYQALEQNTKVEFNIPYLLILEEIIEAHNMPKKLLAQVKHDLFFSRPDYEKYAFIQQHLDDEVYLKKFRKTVLSHLHNMFRENEDYKRTYLQILAAEGNFTLMVETLQANPMSLEILKPHIEKLMLVNKDAVLSALAKYVVEILIEKGSIADQDEIRAFIKTTFDRLEVTSFLSKFWKTSFYYYPESIRTKFFEVFE